MRLHQTARISDIGRMETRRYRALATRAVISCRDGHRASKKKGGHQAKLKFFGIGTTLHFLRPPSEHRAKKKEGHPARHLSETHREATKQGGGRVSRPNCDLMNRSDVRS
ncbi:hypothetical protein CDAR_503111 [Caerostris darwini]|uniref:Uncharacterized protein n=1 Tax=Caerostris darwini TaxID=1538125 RepID=A0AAV4VLP1_9ARAC|nr:hypothetical protein CDAR_503111 [Caerostris darwini]